MLDNFVVLFYSTGIKQRVKPSYSVGKSGHPGLPGQSLTLHEKLPLYHAFDICQRCQRPYLTIPLITFDASQRPFLI